MIIRVDIKDEVSAEAARMITLLRDRRKLSGFIGRAIQKEIADYVLRDSYTRHATAQGLGAKPTGFRGHAAKLVARASALETSETGGALNLPGIHFARAFGDVWILPKNGKFLTIPAVKEAYGKRARSFSNLRFAVVSLPGVKGKRPVLLEAEATQVKWKKDRKSGKRTSAPGKSVGGRVVYYLVRGALQKRDATLLPPENQVKAAALEGAAQGINWLQSGRQN